MKKCTPNEKVKKYTPPNEKSIRTLMKKYTP